jgi:hypothetical protein
LYLRRVAYLDAVNPGNRTPNTILFAPRGPHPDRTADLRANLDVVDVDLVFGTVLYG